MFFESLKEENTSEPFLSASSAKKICLIKPRIESDQNLVRTELPFEAICVKVEENSAASSSSSISEALF